MSFFEEASYQKKLEETRRFYAELFHKRRIKTENALYDQFINSFAPLQMYWVSSLDRGWPSSMRGIRDASQDFVGMLPLDPTLTRQTILDMLKHQQKDGWMPRQISTISRKAPHDMRYFCDGGAFLLELFHEYMTFTRDVSILKERLVWLDSDEESDVLTHILRCTEFYLEAQNIGEHGLCKVWYGDWWDVMDKIGMEGRGETVTVTAQMILNLKNLSDMFRWLYKNGHSEMAYKATRYILPIEEAYAPVEKTFAPPYAIANCYSNSEDFSHRVELQFLSGTVSYVLHTVYQYFFGITPGYEGLTLRPCLPKAFGDCEVEFTYLDKRIHIHFTDAKEYGKVIVNEQEVQTGTDPLSGKLVVTLADELLLEETHIVMK